MTSVNKKRITISTEDIDGGLRITVADTGIGIPKDLRLHLWEWSRTFESHGAGIGLLIAKGIVESFGGEIKDEYSGPSGTAISFTLPKKRLNL